MLSGLIFRLVKGSPLTASEGDSNLRRIRDFCNSLQQLFGVALKPNGTLKDGAVGATAVIADGVVTNAKLAADAKIPAGTIVPFAGGTAPTGWAACDGTAISRTTYADLFTAIGTAWGVGDGSTTFNLPDLRGYALAGSGAVAAGLTNRSVGTKYGSETHTLITDEIPSHNHSISESPDVEQYWGFNSSGGSFGHTSGSQLTATTPTISNAGGGGAHNNLGPRAYVSWIIKVS